MSWITGMCCNVLRRRAPTFWLLIFCTRILKWSRNARKTKNHKSWLERSEVNALVVPTLNSPYLSEADVVKGHICAHEASLAFFLQEKVLQPVRLLATIWPLFFNSFLFFCFSPFFLEVHASVFHFNYYEFFLTGWW